MAVLVAVLGTGAHPADYRWAWLMMVCAGVAAIGPART
jgi:hypothetical protein